jgi:outer membrane immunogenic protein
MKTGISRRSRGVAGAWSQAVFAAALAAIALQSSAATAADVLPYGGPARTPVYSWQGPYVGANLGYQWSSVGGSPTDPSGVAGGVQGGVNWQIGQFVLGAETDFQLSDADDTFAPWKFSNPWFGTLRGRAGVALNNVMFYGTVGLAYGSLTARNTATGVSESKISFGWAGGLGLEVALVGNWSAKAEYLYVDLDDRPYSLTGASHGVNSNLLRLGVNYRF